MFVGDPHRVTGDDAGSLEPLDAALDGGARQAQAPRQLGGGRSGVLPQEGKQAAIGVVGLRFVRSVRHSADHRVTFRRDARSP